MKAIIYARKSTDNTRDQQQSLEIQLEWATNYVKENDITVVETIIEAKSAFKTTGRDGFLSLVEHFEKGNADTLIVYQLDRICRNPLDEGNIKYLTQQGKIKQIISNQGTFDGRQILTLSLFLAMANQYSIDHSFRVERGMKRKAEQGGIITKAPPGYKNNRNDASAKPTDDLVHIVRIFEMRQEGHSMRLIEEQIYNEGFRTKKGLKVGHTVIERILSNPFYYGMINYKGELFKGTHEAIIPKELFDSVNSLGRGAVVMTKREITPLKGKVKFLDNGDVLNCYVAKGKYVFFRSHSRKDYKVSLSQKLIVEYFDKHIQDFCVPKKYLPEIQEILDKEFNEKMTNNTREKNSLNGKITKLDNELLGLRKMRRREELSYEDFIKDKNILVNEIEDLQNRLIGITRLTGKELSASGTMCELFLNLSTNWKNLKEESKLVLIDEMMSELLVDTKKRLYIEVYPLFKAFQIFNVANGGASATSSQLFTPLARYLLSHPCEVKKSCGMLKKIVQ